MIPIIPYCAMVAIANIAILSILLGVFAKMYSKTRSQVHFGMIFFAGMLFADNGVNIYTYFSLFDLYGVTLLPFVLIVRGVQLAGLLVFLKITLQ